jgi:RNA polymerase sigma factor (sigma-70 family)
MKQTLSFTEIYNQYGKMVYNLALNYLQNFEDTEEAVQDIFVKIYEKFEGFNQKSSLKTWIYRITINHCLDVIKSKNRITILSNSIILELPSNLKSQLKQL